MYSCHLPFTEFTMVSVALYVYLPDKCNLNILTAQRMLHHVLSGVEI